MKGLLIVSRLFHTVRLKGKQRQQAHVELRGYVYKPTAMASYA